MNPQMIINMMLSKNPQLQNNPMFQNAMQLGMNGNTAELKKLAENLAREKGVDINALRKQIESNLQI